MKYKLLYLAASLLTVAATPEASAQKAPTRKPVARKPAAQSTVSLKNIATIYRLRELPALDEYLTARKWRFVNSESETGVDQVVYNLHSAGGIFIGKLNIFLCNNEESGHCIRPELHVETSQHIYRVDYRLPKPIFDKLKAEARTWGSPTASQVGDRMITTIYKADYIFWGFRTENPEYSSPKYSVIFGDVTPISEENAPIEDTESTSE
jgi:hypothetical protein